MTQYIYHCNAQTPRYANTLIIWTFFVTEQNACQMLTIFSISSPPHSGEVGFRAMSESLGWAKRPMLHRVHLLPPSMPLTMLYGARSWVDSSSGDKVVQIRSKAHTKVLVSRDAV